MQLFGDALNLLEDDEFQHPPTLNPKAFESSPHIFPFPISAQNLPTNLFAKYMSYTETLGALGTITEISRSALYDLSRHPKGPSTQ